ncbi:hypothetical protein [Algibacter sp. L3A6]|uniref:hypothetical protein n=1 Tax=Algibacter sp. L3A6 TaxID=2686366 RepID=UPI00131A7626|nr:hypothetical protein [Algibacter sp. L3A6]
MENIIAIISLVIAALTFWFTFQSKPKEELDNLKVLFKSTQNISQDLQIELENYINKTESGDLDIFPNISFSTYLAELKKSSKENLSDELYNKFDTMGLTKPVIDSMSKSLENQFNGLQHTLIQLRMRDRQNNV